MYEVRERELNSHASRIERHILAIAQRAHVQQEAFVRAMAEVRTYDDYSRKRSLVGPALPQQRAECEYYSVARGWAA